MAELVPLIRGGLFQSRSNQARPAPGTAADFLASDE